MEAVGVVAVAIAAAVAVAVLYMVVRSLPDLARYRRLRKM